MSKEREEELSRLREMRHTVDGIALVSDKLGKIKVNKKFGKLRTLDTNEKVVKITNNNINKLRVGDLYYISNEKGRKR